MTINELRDCECYTPSGTVSPEAAAGASNSVLHQFYLDYSLPVTNKILVEFNGFWRSDNWNTGNYGGQNGPRVSPAVIAANTALCRRDGTGAASSGGRRCFAPVAIQSTGLAYRNQASFSDSHHVAFFWRGAMSYVTGSHNVKIGLNNDPAWLTNGTNADDPLAYRFSAPLDQGGVANQVTMRSTPYFPNVDVRRNLGIYAQDRWTTHRLTLGYGIRMTTSVGSYRAQHFGPVPLVPNRDISFPAGTTNNWKDITPRTSVSWDVFGTGKTAVKVGLSKYMDAAATNGLDGAVNPFSTLVNSATRSWTDSNGNFIPDCDLLGNPASQNLTSTGGDRCGAISDSSFLVGEKPGIGVDPALKKGWNARDFNWEFSTGVQHELIPGLVADVSYFRRWYGNFTVQDDLALNASDFDQFSIVAPTTTPFATTAPAGTTLPNGGGYNDQRAVQCPGREVQHAGEQLHDVCAKDYGKQIEHWNGVDVSVVARLLRAEDAGRDEHRPDGHRQL